MPLVPRLVALVLSLAVLTGVSIPVARAETWVACSAAADKTVILYRFDPKTGGVTELSRQKLSGEPGPLTLSADHKILFVGLRSTGQLTSLRIDPATGKLTPLRVVSAGADPAQITLDKQGEYLLTAYYEAGKISGHKVEVDGSIAEKAAWEIPTVEKAHAVSLDRYGELLVVPHTGPNAIFQFRYLKGGTPPVSLSKPRINLPPNTGPRHAAWHPRLPIVYINNEQGSSVTAYKAGLEGLTLIEGSTVSTLPGGFKGENSTAEIRMHQSGKVLLVANRGHDSLALFQVDETGTKLTPAGHHPTEKTPRSFCLDPTGKFALAAGEGTGFLEVSEATGGSGQGIGLKTLARHKVGDRFWWVEAFQDPQSKAGISPAPGGKEDGHGALSPDQVREITRGPLPNPWWKLPATGLPLLGALGCLFGYRKRLKLARLVEDIPTSKAHGVFIGLVQVEGTAEAEEPLTTYMEGKMCVHHAWQVQEEWRRTVTETTTDDKGNTVTKTRVESGWDTVAHGGGDIPFYLRDASGVVRVRPEGARIESQSIFNVTCGTNNELYFGLGPHSIIPNSTQRRRFTEQAILLHAPITVVGQARVRDDVAAPEIAADKAAPLFLITVRNEKQVLRGYRWARIGFLILGTILVTGGVFGWHLLQGERPGDPNFNFRTFVPALGAFWCMALVMWTWQLFNSMVDLRNRTDRAYSLIDIELKRRADLIPPLVTCVQALMGHERQTQEVVARLRAQAQASGSGEVEGISGYLVALREAYPNLTADKNTQALMRSLRDTEDRIAMAREYYNDQVVWHNTRVEQIPDCVLAWLAGLRKRSPFLASALDRKEIQVSLHEGS